VFLYRDGDTVVARLGDVEYEVEFTLTRRTPGVDDSCPRSEAMRDPTP
jgi:hypothetical protein